MYFVYYGVLNLLAPMHVEIPYVSRFLIGVYYDFNMSWYSDIGSQLIISLLLKAFGPPIEFLFKYFIRKIKQ